MAVRVRLREISAKDLASLTRMAIAFNNEDEHPLSRGGRQALRELCAGTPHGRGYMIEHERRDVGYVVIGLGFSIEYGGIDAFLDEFYVEPAFRERASAPRRCRGSAALRGS